MKAFAATWKLNAWLTTPLWSAIGAATTGASFSGLTVTATLASAEATPSLTR